jgi:NDP-sugar pyrophosphorylase family protein
MADAILSASSQIQNCALLIVNGDDVTDQDLLTNVVAAARGENVFGVIPAFRSLSYFPGGYLVVDGKRVTGIMEKPGEGNQPSPYIGLLGHYIADSSALLTELDKTRSDQDDIYEKALSTLMKRHSFSIHHHKGNFASLKYPWHVLDVSELLLSRVISHKGTGRNKIKCCHRRQRLYRG